jgi:type II secretion system protein G
MIKDLQFKSEKGFTLIELLIVIGIIGILSTLLMANFVGVRQRARDSQRKADLRQMQAALELYRADIGSYPLPGGSTRINSVACPSSSSLSNASATVTYMQEIPCDPNGATAYNSGNYYYNSNGTTYTLAACLENTSDSQSKTSTPSPAATSACTSGSYYILLNP